MVESGRGSSRRRRTRRRGNRKPLLFPAPSSNPVAEVPEEALELGILAGDAGPSLLVMPSPSPRRRHEPLHPLPRARLLVPVQDYLLGGHGMFGAALPSPPPPTPLPGGEGAGLCLVRRYLTTALGSRASSANGAGKVLDWRSLLANSQSRRLFSYQSLSEVPKWDGSNKSESKEDGEGGTAAQCGGDAGTAAHLTARCRAARAPTRKATLLPGGEVVVQEGDDASVRLGDLLGNLFLFLWDICVAAVLFPVYCALF